MNKQPQLTKESNDIIAIEILARFSQMQGRNGSISKIKKETFIDGVLWALTYSNLLKAQGLYTLSELEAMKADFQREAAKIAWRESKRHQLFIEGKLPIMRDESYPCNEEEFLNTFYPLSQPPKKRTMKTAEEILEAKLIEHIGNDNKNNFQPLDKIKVEPEWKICLEAMEEYANQKKKEWQREVNDWFYPEKGEYPEMVENENYSLNVLAEVEGMNDIQVMCYCYIPGEDGGFIWANCDKKLDGDAEFDDNYTVKKWKPIPQLN